ncbi:DUF4199 domain-containing protein [Fluviicola taffensis]|jgi:hypothetical protein|uniref:DUF4199 domain-containing protein n=1 Tax=Fluviicola taffensis (strain DSM 16823 / NCIMB 13979 / RW262) TaxID=755732 RepID=F2IAD2_FLUTR|nr:DUF4199 domain-containing protein [Fluviicola taffensis]AEA42067.1 hypothetical protein Fluta_0057 [Fluviicola taffensis DSM 16823]
MNTRYQPIRYGIYSFAGIAILFLLVKLFSLENVGYLRLLNVFIVFYFTNKLAKRNRQLEPDDNYLYAFGSLILANAITVILSVVSFVIYANFIQPDFITHFDGGIFWNNDVTIDQAAAVLFFEGMGSALAVSFIVVMYWNERRPDNTCVPVEALKE